MSRPWEQEWGQAGSHFDMFAATYDRAFDERSASGNALRSRLALTLRLVGDGPGRLLDVGVGPGRLVAELSRRGWDVSGVDASPEMVRLTRSRVPAAADRIVQSVIEDLPFDDASFDTVTATGVLEYSDVSRAAFELARVLRPGGMLIVSYPNPSAMYRYSKTHFWYPLVRAGSTVLRRNRRRPQGALVIRPSELRTLIEQNGLTGTTTHYTSFVPVIAPFDSLMPRLACWLAELAERRGRRLSRIVAGQLIYVARKGAQAGSSASPHKAR